MAQSFIHAYRYTNWRNCSLVGNEAAVAGGAITLGEGAFSLNNEGYAIATEARSWGEVKALYR